MAKGKGGSPKVKVTPTAAGKDKVKIDKVPTGDKGWKEMPFAH
jgi:hypothetical protein